MGVAAALDQEYEVVEVDRIRPHPENPRHGNLEAIRESIRTNGFYGACLVQLSTGHILVGNHRYIAATEEGLLEVPVVWADVDDATARRIMLADNRTTDLATYDDSILIDLLTAVARNDDLVGSGYTREDIELLLMNDDIDASLAALEVDYPLDDDSEKGLWRRLDVRLPPGLYEAWGSWWTALSGDDDIEKARNLIET